jgi:hypothetical protein
MTNAALERVILHALADVHPNMMPERTLLSDVIVRSADVPTQTAIRSSLANLESKRQVVGVGNDDGTKWKITPEGLARLAGA